MDVRVENDYLDKLPSDIAILEEDIQSTLKIITAIQNQADTLKTQAEGAVFAENIHKSATTANQQLEEVCKKMKEFCAEMQTQAKHAKEIMGED